MLWKSALLMRFAASLGIAKEQRSLKYGTMALAGLNLDLILSEGANSIAGA